MEEVIKRLNLNSKKIEQFKIYYEFLIEENKKYNLTAITDESEVYIKHFYDSVMMGKFIDLEEKTLCDIGSGAGFPSIPLKIMYPSLKVTIIEPTLKRINFLKELIKKLELDNVELVCKRAEDAIINYRESFDIVTARAVSNLRMLLELTIPYAKVNGSLISYKGSSYQEELELANNAIEKLKSKVSNIYEYDLLNGMGKRYLIEIKKYEKTTSKYPRRFAEIKNKPL